jgi:hypothetical protein
MVGGDEAREREAEQETGDDVGEPVELEVQPRAGDGDHEGGADGRQEPPRPRCRQRAAHELDGGHDAERSVRDVPAREAIRDWVKMDPSRTAPHEAELQPLHK